MLVHTLFATVLLLAHTISAGIPAPSNDNCADAQALVVDQTVSGTLIGATQDQSGVDEADESCGLAVSPRDFSVWYTFTNTEQYAVSFTPEVSVRSQVITRSVRHGTCLTQRCNRQHTNTYNNFVDAGETVLVVLSGLDGLSARVDYNITARVFPQVANDFCSTAQELDLSGGAAGIFGETFGATWDDLLVPCSDNGQSGCQSLTEQYGRGLWYRFTAPQTTTLSIQASNSQHPVDVTSGLHVYSGTSCDDLQCEFSCYQGSTVSVTAGETYWVVFNPVASSLDDNGRFAFVVREQSFSTEIPYEGSVGGSDSPDSGSAHVVGSVGVVAVALLVAVLL